MMLQIFMQKKKISEAVHNYICWSVKLTDSVLRVENLYLQVFLKGRTYIEKKLIIYVTDGFKFSSDYSDEFNQNKKVFF